MYAFTIMYNITITIHFNALNRLRDGGVICITDLRSISNAIEYVVRTRLL